MSREQLTQLAEHVADVSPAWRDVVALGADAADFTHDALADRPTEVRGGVEAIREGWLLHRAGSQIAASAPPNLALLIGDWAYAAGLVKVSEHGSLDDVAALARLIADSSAAHGDDAPAHERRWSQTMTELA